MEVLAENEAVTLSEKTSGPSSFEPRPPGRTASMSRSRMRPLAPTRSSDLTSMRAGTIQRKNALGRSSSSMAGGPRRAAPQRTSSVDSTNSLRAYRRDQIANTPVRVGGIQRKASLDGGGLAAMAAAATAARGEPDRYVSRNVSSTSIMSASDLSCFTMDSVNLRKSQLVADPLDGETYNDDDSFADHESRASGLTDFVPDNVHRSMERANSFSTIASALTSGFADDLLDKDELLEEEEDLLLQEGLEEDDEEDKKLDTV